MSLEAEARWFLAAFRADQLPTRVHAPLKRGPWHDASGGSLLGAPADDPEFARFLSSPTAVRVDFIDGRERVRYRWPMAAALARLSRSKVRRGFPPVPATLRAVAAADGDVRAAVDALAVRYPRMAERDGDAGVDHIYYSLGRARGAYASGPVPRRGTSRAPRTPTPSVRDLTEVLIQ
jgi:hypothetical protein